MIETSGETMCKIKTNIQSTLRENETRVQIDDSPATFQLSDSTTDQNTQTESVVPVAQETQTEK